MTETRSPQYQLYHFFWELIDYLFPPTCGGCDRSNERWCSTCQQSIVRITSRFCLICGQPHQTTGVCPECLVQRPVYTMLRSYGEYGGSLRNAILRLKFRRDIGLAEALSKHLISLYNELNMDIDLIVPVPLNKTRQRKRGYNQAGLLALPLAYAICKPYKSQAIERIRDTHSQVRLGASERKKNVQDAFHAHSRWIDGKKVLVVDDVTTTGSTMSACAKALSQAGASAVYGLTLARAVLQADVDDQPI